MSKCVLLAGILHETHSFVSGETTVSDFQVKGPDEILASIGQPSPLSGVLEVGDEKGWKIVPSIYMIARPGPIVCDEVIDFFSSRFKQTAESLSLQPDGIYLDLHGAMASVSYLDAEGEILERIRRLPGLKNVPIFGTLDLHGNFTERMARYSQGLLAYQKNPHTDGKATARRAAMYLDRIMHSGENAVTVCFQPPIVWPPSGTGTEFEPMFTLESTARLIENADPDILAVNVFGGFSFSDLPEAGVCFSAVTTGRKHKAEKYLQELAETAWEMRTAGIRGGAPLDEAVRSIPPHIERPVLLVEPADNIGGGAPGDNTLVLQALIENKVQNAGVVINDPEAVQQLWQFRQGEVVSLDIGGKSRAMGAHPLHLVVELLRKSDGVFTLEDLHSHSAIAGSKFDMGPCALVQHQGVTILITSKATPPEDLGQWRSQGVNPESLSVIGIKAAIAYRQAYEPIAGMTIVVDTPGPCAENLRRLPYTRIRRPVFPLDEFE
jgi:microcystin degradation protein MlrC